MSNHENSIPLFILPKKRAFERVDGKIPVDVESLLNDGPPLADEFYLYVQINSLESTSSNDETMKCQFEELDLDSDSKTDKRGELNLRGRRIVQVLQCVDLPASFILCNFRVTGPTRNAARLNLFDIQLEFDENRADNGSIYKIEIEEVQERPQQRAFELDDGYTALGNVDMGEGGHAVKLNVYGVIKQIVEMDKGTLKLYLTDPSLNYDGHIICFIAAKSRDSLPIGAKVGDVFRLHRISARFQHGVMQLFGRMESFGLSWLLFDGTPGAHLVPKSSSASFTMKESDTATARTLRSWFKIRSDKVIDGRAVSTLATNTITLLMKFPTKSYGNILAQVIGVFESVHSSRPAILRVWDGTKCSTKTKKVDPERENQPIWSFDKELCQAVADYYVDVFIYETHRKGALNLTAGQYVLLTNVHLALMEAPNFYFAMHGNEAMGAKFGRGIKEISATDPQVQELKTRLDGFIAELPVDQRVRLTNRTLFDATDVQNGESSNAVENGRAGSVPPNVRIRGTSPPQGAFPRPNSTRTLVVEVEHIPRPVRVAASSTNPSPALPSSTSRQAARASPTPSGASSIEQYRRPPLPPRQPAPSPRKSPPSRIRSPPNITNPSPSRSSSAKATATPPRPPPTRANVQLRHPTPTTPRPPSTRSNPSPARTTRASTTAASAAEETQGNTESIYSQATPRYVTRNLNEPRPEVASISIGTSQAMAPPTTPKRASLSALKLRQSNGRATVQSATPTVETPKRSTQTQRLETSTQPERTPPRRETPKRSEHDYARRQMPKTSNRRLPRAAKSNIHFNEEMFEEFESSSSSDESEDEERSKKSKSKNMESSKVTADDSSDEDESDSDDGGSTRKRKVNLRNRSINYQDLPGSSTAPSANSKSGDDGRKRTPRAKRGRRQ